LVKNKTKQPKRKKIERVEKRERERERYTEKCERYSSKNSR
jgi:hypothetical protein